MALSVAFDTIDHPLLETFSPLLAFLTLYSPGSFICVIQQNNLLVLSYEDSEMKDTNPVLRS